MKNIFEIGNLKTYEVLVESKDTAAFDSGTVHPVYATFALGRDAEWCCRLFVLEMKEEDEEGIGTYLSISHKQPALVGERVKFVAKVEKLNKNEIVCSYEAFVGDRLIAFGEQGQKILKKERLEKMFNDLSSLNN
jgi:fluoroacetyl-CoA thioesterase